MEKHKCKLCYKTFINGRALGGHMKVHLTRQQLSDREDQTESASSLYSYEKEENEEKAPMGVRGLRENPKRSFRFTDPDFSFAVNKSESNNLVQDRESETESRNPTRRRSKRNKRSDFGDTQKEKFDSKLKNLTTHDNVVVDREALSSSVSDTTSLEEDVAMSLVMLSKDSWEPNNEVKGCYRDTDERKVNKIRGKFRCGKCMKLFRSSQALGGHKRVCSVVVNGTEEVKINASKGDVNKRIFECPYCFKVFGSGQALGGHKRSHLLINLATETSGKAGLKLIDLNLPAPLEDDDYSVVSDA